MTRSRYLQTWQEDLGKPDPHLAEGSKSTVSGAD
eukprot:CAMPEP_0197903834 /NCGR_PEP_ID=MMETSP1439-20131203/56784_1 /TAXON_ID=66791 /ORGANISM="Gonyaulax spinifera, Strain CCMP409" /LENGTH=33 /DNA_ID= /DNA_START= /DNA_END= /DNA_ORIENTATION=